MQTFAPLIALGILLLYFVVPRPRSWNRWLALAAVVLIYPVSFGSLFDDARLAWSGERVTGTVLSASCGSGKGAQSVFLTYRYDAGGISMVGKGKSGQGNGNCGMRAGDPVHVSYLPREPNVSTAVQNPALALFWKLLTALGLYLFLVYFKSEHGEQLREHMKNFSFRRP